MARTKPETCVGCALHSHGTDFTQIEGTGSLGLMCIAEASGEAEARDGLPLRPYAPAGSLFERTLRRMSVDRSQLFVSNCIRCRPRNNWLSGAPYEYSALSSCRPNLIAAVETRKPKALFAMGDIALRELTGESGEARGVSHLRGYCLPAQDDLGCLPVVASFHPAYIRRGKASHQGLFARDLQRAINVARGRDTSYIWNLPEALSNGTLTYLTHPSLDDATAFYHRVRENPGAVLSYDLETFESASLDEDARDGFQDTRIRLVQFSLAAGGGIAFPWEGGYRSVAQAILKLPNDKCGHNVWRFDNRVLRAAGEREGLDLLPTGKVFDTLEMFHFWQPDLPAHLQFAASFASFPFPWKHLNGTDLELYSCVDVDATLRLYNMLCTTMQRDGVWGDWDTQGYTGQVHNVRPVYAAMEDRGLPIDDDARLALDKEFDAAQAELQASLDARFPDSARSIHPKEGYKKVPKDITGLVEREFKLAELDAEGNPVERAVTRWCRLEPFSPNSGPQLLRYMKAKRHKAPTSKKEQNEDGSEKETTAKKELVRLANKTGDDFYLKVIECRELGKVRGTYIDGFKPHSDGRVHTTFTFDTGTGQISSRNPNITNFIKHGRLAKATRKIVAAPPGYLLSEWDFKSYHVLTTGFEAEDPTYMRMARLDMHSFIAGCFLNLWKPEIMEETDEALLERFRWLKCDAARKRVRDKQAKPSILGVGFGMGARRLYQENLEHFPDERTARRFLELLQHVFPKVFAWQGRIRRLAHEQTYLKSRFGMIRRFYEVFVWDSKKHDWKNGDQAEEAVAFLPANHAFGNIRECLKEMDRRGLSEKYGLINNVHDSLMYCFPADLRDEHIAEVYPVLIQPSRVLKHPTIAPSGLIVDAECSIGKDWSVMQEVSLKEVLACSASASAVTAG